LAQPCWYSLVGTGLLRGISLVGTASLAQACWMDKSTVSALTAYKGTGLSTMARWILYLRQQLLRNKNHATLLPQPRRLILVTRCVLYLTQQLLRSKNNATLLLLPRRLILVTRCVLYLAQQLLRRKNNATMLLLPCRLILSGSACLSTHPYLKACTHTLTHTYTTHTHTHIHPTHTHTPHTHTQAYTHTHAYTNVVQGAKHYESLGAVVEEVSLPSFR
jgi:hypothetical protein